MISPEQQTSTIQQSLDLALQHHQAGRLPEAESLYQQILQDDPNHPAALHMLGVLANQFGQNEIAVELITKALGLRPEIAEAHNNLGNSLQDLGRFGEAVESYRGALAIKPDYAKAHSNLGNVFTRLGKMDEAVQSYQGALNIKPDYVEAHTNLGNALQDLSLPEEAIESYQNALNHKPDHAEAHNNFGNVLKGLGELEDALACYQKALDINPGYVEAHSNLIFCMANSSEYGPKEILEEARRWNKAHARPLAAQPISHANAPNPDRRLKIGYLSGDIRQHPVGFFMEPVFKNHDKSAFEVHVYATQHKSDQVTERIKGHIDQWHDAAHLTPQALAEAVRDDGIDIVADLSGHAAYNGYLTLARRPAPVQILGIGNFCTSGLDCVDGLLSDPFETPEGTDSHFSEPLIRMPDGFVCYQPPDYAPDVGPSPCLSLGYITFGCFNNLAKVSKSAIALWAEILKQVPESRLLLKNMALASNRASERLKSLFTSHGVSEDRLLLEPGLPHEPFMAEYGRVDIGLDPIPYSGGLTTIEALWMGVPVVTLCGQTFAARHSTSHLNNAGLEDLVTKSSADYVRKVLELSADFSALNALRQSLRPKLAASPILDGERYTRNLEQNLRQLWRQWCEKS